MKILYNIHSLEIGGAETVVVNFLIALKKMGHDVVLVLDERKEGFLQDKVDQCGIPTRALRPQNSYSFWGKMKRWIVMKTTDYHKCWTRILEEEMPDIVHLHSNAWAIPFPAERTVFTFHSDVERNLSIMGDAHRAKLMALAEKGIAFFCLSDPAQADVRRIFHTDRTVRLPNGVDLAEIRSRTYDRTEFLRQLGIPEDAFVLGHVGRFHPVKNHSKIIEVFAEVARRRNACLILVGTGEAEYVASVKQQVQERGLEDRVVFLGLRSDSTEIMSTFDALVLPSLSESFSLTLVEAQALGVRCVSSDAVPQEVVCNDNCFALKLNDSAQTWADYVLGDFLEPKAAELEQFDMKNVVNMLVEQYASLSRREQ